jgi:hypothetical protein
MTAALTATEIKMKMNETISIWEADITTNVDAQPCVTGQLSIPRLTNNVTMNKENMILRHVRTQMGRTKLKTCKYEKTQTVLLEHFRPMTMAVQQPLLGNSSVHTLFSQQ